MVPKINDRDKERNITFWSPIFKDCLSNSYWLLRPLIWIFLEDPMVADESIHPILANWYYGESENFLSALESCLSPEGPIFKNENAAVCMKIKEAVHVKSVESSIKYFSRRKDRRCTFQCLISNYVSELKHREFSKIRLNMLQNIKWKD